MDLCHDVLGRLDDRRRGERSNPTAGGHRAAVQASPHQRDVGRFHDRTAGFAHHAGDGDTQADATRLCRRTGRHGQGFGFENQSQRGRCSEAGQSGEVPGQGGLPDTRWTSRPIATVGLGRQRRVRRSSFGGGESLQRTILEGLQSKSQQKEATPLRHLPWLLQQCRSAEEAGRTSL